MIKHFCDECKKELTAEEIQFSLEMTGKELCFVHAHEHINTNESGWFEANGKHYKKDDASGFLYPID